MAGAHEHAYIFTGGIGRNYVLRDSTQIAVVIFAGHSTEASPHIV